MYGTDSEELVGELRKIVRTLDLHSRWLSKAFALTSPQLVSLNQISKKEGLTIGDLARLTSLSCATATGIVDRLEQRGLVRRSRNGRDRRQVQLNLTEEGQLLCQRRPPLLQEGFLRTLEQLDKPTKEEMLRSLRFLAEMMTGMMKEHLPGDFSGGGLLASGEPEPPLNVQPSPEGFLESCRMLMGDGDGKSARSATAADAAPGGCQMHEIFTRETLEARMSADMLASFLHENLKPYEDTEMDIKAGVERALSSEPGRGGFVLMATKEGATVGALVILKTGMAGYVPPNLLLFVAVAPEHRGCGVGAALVRRAQALAGGDVKLHCEHDNPARRLYERMGFASKYLEMRWSHEPGNH